MPREFQEQQGDQGGERSCEEPGEAMGFPGGSGGKEPACDAGDPGSIPQSGRSPEKERATHSSSLAWKLAWTEEPGGLQSMGLQSWTRLSD